MTERIERYWMVKTNGAEQISVRPGSSVEIGRRPLRPMADDGFVRWEVTDETRSMSKRHAIFAVDDEGAALVRDLGSTNGSYLVGSDGTLKRLEAGTDLRLSGSPVRMQFGDVPVDCIRIDEPVVEQPEPEPKVPNLFEYAASDEVRQEPDASDMSVDDILNLRAGEPTTALRQSAVAHRLEEVAAAAARSFPPQDGDGGADADDAVHDDVGHAGTAVDGSAVTDSGAAAPNMSAHDGDHGDGASNAEDHGDGARPTGVTGAGASREDKASSAESSEQQVDQSEQQVEQSEERVELSEQRVEQSERQIEQSEQSSEQPAEQQLSFAIIPDRDAGEREERDLFVDALRESDDDRTDGPGSQVADDAAGAGEGDAESVAAHAARLASDASHAAHSGNIPVREVFGAQASASHTEAGNDEDTNTPDADVTDTGAAAPADTSAQEDASASRDASDSPSDATVVFTPAFEPGSVFDRVTHGQFGPREPAVQVNGLTSDQAKSTTDFTEQFEIARHPQLLPFLAMNPSLYDDLYAWLSAQGNADIDTALSKNAGYSEYRTAVGK
ncbi:FHA domain-containing protein [Bifidobacterium mongoliense]|uniref:variant leucine-rich repeat-containing protein n=2 Tax=Bifidobacterium mongoliense TaxID=518643 RepID=UPI003BEEDA36